MPKAIWRGVVLAESDETKVIECNHYFPPDSLERSCFRPSDTETVCGWKGIANYYDVEVDGQTNKDAAWYYASPKPAAAEIANHVAFWKGVTIE